LSYDRRVEHPVPDPDCVPPSSEETQDDQGVDRSQIRAFLALTARERLERASRLAAFFLRAQKLNVRRRSG
jgi:hypothetical protein